MTDRRRVNGPPGGTAAPIFVSSPSRHTPEKPQRTRKPNELRKIFLKTGLVPSASGSAYLELEAQPNQQTLTPAASTLKLTCAVHGPKPVARTTSFSPNLQLVAHVKFAPFAARQRRGYLRDSAERDLGVHVETALKGLIIPDRWPKSAIEIVITVLEGEDDGGITTEVETQRGLEGVGMMNVLAGCLTVASAALADARIDCLDLMAGGVAATTSGPKKGVQFLDPCPAEHEDLSSACVVGYLPARDEITELWVKGDMEAQGDSSGLENLVDSAINAAKGVQSVLQEAVRESAAKWVQQLKAGKSLSVAAPNAVHDVDMQT